MKSIIDEAVDSFNQNHQDRCLGRIFDCHHADLIRRIKKYQKEIEQPLREEIAAQLMENRDHWVSARNQSEASEYVWALNNIFELAIKFTLGE
jgi:hypothetical protein